MYGAAERSQALEQEVERLQSEIIRLNEIQAETHPAGRFRRRRLGRARQQAL
jgi:hypothetical protein